MKVMRKIFLSLSMILLSAPLLFGQELSKYGEFSLGTSLAELSKRVGPFSHSTTLIHQRPAVIQELTFWTLTSSRSPVGVDPSSQILFSFYNRELYRIMVTYDRDATKGLTDDDMVQAVSTRYGTGIRLYPEISLPTNDEYPPRDKVIARWIDSQNSVSLIRSSTLDSYGLVVLSKRLDAQATAANIESEELDKQEAPQVEIGRLKKEADELEVARQINQKSFRP